MAEVDEIDARRVAWQMWPAASGRTALHPHEHARDPRDRRGRCRTARTPMSYRVPHAGTSWCSRA